ncbi:MAG: hypothetical protein RIQ56_214 [Candidatus Parcubacteria bacterium]|jgi:uncharacterized membrane protein YoaK (UPF0700 family)
MVLSLQLALWVVALAAVLVVFVLGCITAYHWMRYALNPFMTLFTITAYIGISCVLLLSLFASLLAVPTV